MAAQLSLAFEKQEITLNMMKERHLKKLKNYIGLKKFCAINLNY